MGRCSFAPSALSRRYSRLPGRLRRMCGRSLAADSPFDRYAEGDRRALSPAAESGLLLFRGKARCTGCHVGPLLSDEQFHNTGVAWRTPAISAGSEQAGDFADLGRFVVTGKDEDRGAFKTPTLREVARTAPVHA